MSSKKDNKLLLLLGAIGLGFILLNRKKEETQLLPPASSFVPKTPSIPAPGPISQIAPKAVKYEQTTPVNTGIAPALQPVSILPKNTGIVPPSILPAYSAFPQLPTVMPQVFIDYGTSKVPTGGYKEPQILG